jgi:hypothetical protein
MPNNRIINVDNGDYISLKTPRLGAHKVGQSGEYDFGLLIGNGAFIVDSLPNHRSKIKIHKSHTNLRAREKLNDCYFFSYTCPTGVELPKLTKSRIDHTIFLSLSTSINCGLLGPA